MVSSKYVAAPGLDLKVEPALRPIESPASLPASPSQPSFVPSAGVDDGVNALELADQFKPKGAIASLSTVDQSVDATEPSPYRPARLPSFIPSDAKSYFYWHLCLNRVNVLRDNMLGILQSFNKEADAYFDSLRGPRLKFHDFINHPFPFPAKLGLKRLHSYLGALLFQEGYTEDELFPDDEEEVDAAFDCEFECRLRAGAGFSNVNYASSLCSFCGADQATAKCTRCKLATYCNRDCQSAHWKAHKPACVDAAKSAASV